jgi:hypothetical protein
MSYCLMCCCLRCRRVMYLDSESGQWVHQDGWPDCEPWPPVRAA